METGYSLYGWAGISVGIWLPSRGFIVCISIDVRTGGRSATVKPCWTGQGSLQGDHLRIGNHIFKPHRMGPPLASAGLLHRHSGAKSSSSRRYLLSSVTILVSFNSRCSVVWSASISNTVVSAGLAGNIFELRQTNDKIRSQLVEAQQRERMLVRRLTSKEQENQEYMVSILQSSQH